MTTIDHRILIPAAPDLVWNYISDITHNPDWQLDCRDVVFLTSRREGPGLRWRYSAPGGDRVVAVTAWYNGLGYEYYFVDGVPFRENKGRLRLQEIPEGTIVQWTFHYELGGLLGGVRNTLSLNRQTDHAIAESLRGLWQQMKESGATSQEHEAKSLMREAPDVNARSAYQPRHPSPAQEGQKPQPTVEPPIASDDAQPIRIIEEPPIREDDTRPRPNAPVPTPASASVTVTDTSEIPADLEGEPEFLNQLDDYSRFEPPRQPSDTQPRKPIEEPVAKQPPVVTPATPPKAAPPVQLPSQHETEPFVFGPPPTDTTPVVRPIFPPGRVPPDFESLVQREQEAKPQPPTPKPEPQVESKPAPEPEPIAAPEPDVNPAAEPESEPESAPEPLAPVYQAPSAPPATPSMPTPPSTPPVRLGEPQTAAAPSIWEVFGLPRPSETQEAASVTPAAALPPVAEPAADVSATIDEPPEPEPVSVVSPVSDELPAEPISVVSATSDESPIIDEPPLQAGDSVLMSIPPASSRIGLRVGLRRRLVRVRRS